MFGVIRSIDEEELQVEVSEGVVVRMARRAVAGIVEHDDEEDTEPEEEPDSGDGDPIDPVESGSEPAEPS